MLRRLLLPCLLLPAFLACSGQPRVRTVDIFQYADHPSLDLIADGIERRMRTHDPVLVFRRLNAHGEPATANLVAQQIASDDAALVVVIATPAAQACDRHVPGKPIVFAAVADPLAAGIVESLEHPGRRITGVSNALPVPAVLAYVRQVAPACRRLGVISNPAEVNSEVTVTQLLAACRDSGPTIERVSVASSSEVFEAAQHLAGRVDGFLMVNDNTVASAFAALHRVAVERRVPLFATDRVYIDRGALGGVSIDFAALGEQAADMAARVLNGEDPGRIPVETFSRFTAYLNPAAARAQGLAVPAAALPGLVIVNTPPQP